MYRSEVYGKGGIYAKVVAASIANDIPIYTLETKAPKFIDAEFEKHRMLSSNSSSSRAIPFKRLFIDGIYLPFDVRQSQSGMQGDHALEEQYVNYFRESMRELFEDSFEKLDEWSTVHKQHRNRYLEPWMYQVKVVTATEWDNFFRLRLAPDAQPEIQELARCMKEAMEEALPFVLKKGEWHLPYMPYGMDGFESADLETEIKCSVARCARVSYKTHDNQEPSVEKDLALYDQLLSSRHMTPFEHQATPMNKIDEMDMLIENLKTKPGFTKGVTHISAATAELWSGNFRGWIQFRQLVDEWNG